MLLTALALAHATEDYYLEREMLLHRKIHAAHQVKSYSLAAAGWPSALGQMPWGCRSTASSESLGGGVLGGRRWCFLCRQQLLPAQQIWQDWNSLKDDFRAAPSAPLLGFLRAGVTRQNMCQLGLLTVLLPGKEYQIDTEFPV